MPNLRTLAAAVALFCAASLGGVAHAESTAATNPPKAAAGKGKPRADKKVSASKKKPTAGKVAHAPKQDLHAAKKAENKPATHHSRAKTDGKKDKAPVAKTKTKASKSVAKVKPAGTDKKKG